MRGGGKNNARRGFRALRGAIEVWSLRIGGLRRSAQMGYFVGLPSVPSLMALTKLAGMGRYSRNSMVLEARP